MKRLAVRAGFTVHELLVVMVVLAVLLGLLVPAVQMARESARQTQCRARLSQFGLAIANFEARHGSYPMDAGPTGTAPNGVRSSMQYSMQAQLLADLGYPAEAAQFNFSRIVFLDWVRPINGPPRMPVPEALPRVPAFLCPSDHGTLGLNYRACVGAFPQSRRSTDDDRTLQGAFARGVRVRASDVTDGLSQTAAMSERIQSFGDGTSFRPPGDYWNVGAASLLGLEETTVTAAEMRDVCGSLSGAPPRFTTMLGTLWHTPSYAHTNYNHVGRPNDPIADCALGGWTGLIAQSHAGLHAARSRHSGGVHVLFLDGSVRLVADPIDASVWSAFGSIAGHETTGG